MLYCFPCFSREVSSAALEDPSPAADSRAQQIAIVALGVLSTVGLILAAVYVTPILFSAASVVGAAVILYIAYQCFRSNRKPDPEELAVQDSQLERELERSIQRMKKNEERDQYVTLESDPSQLILWLKEDGYQDADIQNALEKLKEASIAGLQNGQHPMLSLSTVRGQLILNKAQKQPEL